MKDHKKDVEVPFSLMRLEGDWCLSQVLGLDLGLSWLVEMAPLIRKPLELFS